MKRCPWLAPLCGAVLSGCAVLSGGATAPARAWHELFDGRSLGAFAITEFGGQGEVSVRDHRLQLGIGSPLTGVTWTGPLPLGDYELEVVAARELGGDFFCGITFPVGEAHLTLVLGGWGGSVCGLSSLDGNDAAHNHTRCLRRFTLGTDYRVQIVVRSDHVQCRLDGEALCATPIRPHALGLRPEMNLSRPLGIASFATAASVQSARWRALDSQPVNNPR